MVRRTTKQYSASTPVSKTWLHPTLTGSAAARPVSPPLREKESRSEEAAAVAGGGGACWWWCCSWGRSLVELT